MCSVFILLRLNESTTFSTCKIPLSNPLCGHQRLSEYHTHVPALCSSVTLTQNSWCLHSISPSHPEPHHSAGPWFAPFSSYCFFISSVGSICLTSSLLFYPRCTLQGKFPLVSPLHVHRLSIQTLSRTCLQRLPRWVLWLASPHSCPPPHRSKPNVISSGLLPLLPSWFCPGDYQSYSLSGLDIPAIVLLSYPIPVSQCHHSYNYSNHSTTVGDISESLGRVLE